MTYDQQQFPPPPPPSSRPRPMPAASRPWWKGVWFIAALALVLGVIIGVAGGSGAADKPKAGPTVSVTATRTTTATATQSITDTVSATVTTTPTVLETIATKTRTQTVTYTPPPPKEYTDGTYVVGTEIRAGTYHSDGGQGYCAWIRLSTLTGALSGNGIIDLGNTSNGPLTVQILASDKAFEIQGESCSFHRVG